MTFKNIHFHSILRSARYSHWATGDYSSSPQYSTHFQFRPVGRDEFSIINLLLMLHDSLSVAPATRLLAIRRTALHAQLPGCFVLLSSSRINNDILLKYLRVRTVLFYFSQQLKLQSQNKLLQLYADDIWGSFETRSLYLLWLALCLMLLANAVHTIHLLPTQLTPPVRPFIHHSPQIIIIVITRAQCWLFTTSSSPERKTNAPLSPDPIL